MLRSGYPYMRLVGWQLGWVNPGSIVEAAYARTGTGLRLLRNDIYISYSFVQ